MSKGALIYAHNSEQLDYLTLAVISGGLVKKNLKVPVSLVTDSDTLTNADSHIAEYVEKIFDTMIVVDKPVTTNYRNIFVNNKKETIPFINSNRNSVWDLTPYDRTLLIDSDYLTLSSTLNEYWDITESMLIGCSANDISNINRLEDNDYRVSDTSIKLRWATTVMFTKNKESKMFFDLVDDIRKKYSSYADVYGFEPRQYRNDISFSIAAHILANLNEDRNYMLPPILTALEQDILFDVKDEIFKFLIKEKHFTEFYAASISKQDIHVMNKQSILDNKEKLLELI